MKDDVAFLSDRSKPVRDRIAKLFPNEDREPDSAELPDRVILSFFESDCVSDSWKQHLLRKLADERFYGIMLVPLEFAIGDARAAAGKGCCKPDASKDDSWRCYVLGLLYNGEFKTLDSLFVNGCAERFSATPGMWGYELFHLLLLADYDWAQSDGNRFLRPAVEWIEKTAPGTVAGARDKFGNNALMYLYGTMKLTNPCYLARTWDGVEMPEGDAAFLKGLGCEEGVENVFGVSYEMLHR